MGSVQGFFLSFSLSVFFLFMLPLVSYVEGTSLYTSLRYQAEADAYLRLFCVVFKNQLVARRTSDLEGSNNVDPWGHGLRKPN